MDRLHSKQGGAAAAGRRRASRIVLWCATLCIVAAPAAAWASAPDPGLPPAPLVAKPSEPAPVEEQPVDEERAAQAVALDASVSQLGAWAVLHDDEAVEEAIAASAQDKERAAASGQSSAGSTGEDPGMGPMLGGALAVASCTAAVACFVVGWRRTRRPRRSGSSGLRDPVMGIARG